MSLFSGPHFAVRALALLGILVAGTLRTHAAVSQAGTQREVRIRQNFNAGWVFKRQVKGSGELGSFDRDNEEASKIEPRFQTASQPAYDDSWWESVDLPHTWNAQDVSDAQPGYWRGIGWYRKHFRLDPKHAGKKIFLEFEGVNSVAEVWLNGKSLGSHKGGYTGFEFEITPLFGTDNVLTVKVDNLYRATLPPTVKTDLCFYGGIYRDVWLRIVEPIYISDVFWKTPQVSEAQAQVELSSVLTNQTSRVRHVTLTQEILDPSAIVVDSVSTSVTVPAGQTTTLKQKSNGLKDPRLWSPETPNLYHIRTSLKEDSRFLDETEIPLGFRWFRFDPVQGFLLNGKRVQIQGTNCHQSYPGMGNALPNSRHVKDMEMIREMGANFWRTSHYPHDVSTMDASDRLGLMVWDELPILKEIGNTGEYIANVSNMAREMIQRDRNHPSVVLWGIAGEINAPKSVSYRVVDAISKLYRQLDATRPVAMHEPRGEDIAALVDVVGLGGGVSPENEQKHASNPGRSYMVSEFSSGGLIGRGMYGMGKNSEDLALDGHEKHLREVNQRPWLAGIAIWNQFDFEGETYDDVIPHVNSFGMVDIWRFPKEVYYFYQSQWTEKPMVHIVGHWTWPGEEGKTRTVKVYSNAQEVELFLNGGSLGTKKNVRDAGLLRPPRLWEVQYQPGALKAVARTSAGEIVDERKTAGPAYRILLESDTPQLISGDPESLAYITASVVDEAGVTVPGDHSPISFTSYGPGRLLEQTWLTYGTGLTWNSVDGKTRVAFRSAPRSGMAVISAYSPGVRMGRIEIDVSAPGKPDEMNYKELFKEDELTR
jgi:beta-galactosidase